MEFPVAGVTINPLFLVGVGFLVGVLGGFFGVGGGFIAGPMMILLGVPTNFVVGTDLAHMTGKSIVAFKRHRAQRALVHRLQGRVQARQRPLLLPPDRHRSGLALHPGL